MNKLFTFVLGQLGFLGYENNKQQLNHDIWYDGTKPTKKRIAELRYKLAVARGMLVSVRDMMRDVKVGGELCTNIEDMNKAIDESSD